MALILNRGKPRKGGSVAPATLRLHGKDVIAYSLDILRHYGETIVVSELPSERGRLDDQVLNILQTLSVSSASVPDFVLTHDADRPLITHDAVRKVLALLLEGRKSVTVSVPNRDSQWVNNSFIRGEVSLQTPEGFPFMLLLKAQEWRTQVGRVFTSATELVASWSGIPPTLVQLPFSNSRVETQGDLASVEGVLKFGQECIKEPPGDLTGLHVLVLGGSGGIGKACIESIGELGATFDAPSRRELDLRHGQGYADLGSYQAVIHAAGAYDASPEEIMQVNFLSCLNLLSCAERKEWRGNIVLISSAASSWGRPGIAVYSASKAAVNALIESEADRLARKGIVVNGIAPGKVNTRLQSIINPHIGPEEMISPRYVSEMVMRYLRTTQYGKLVFIRKGFDMA